MIAGLLESGSRPVLQQMIAFTEARQELLAHNVANLSTPYFEPRDLSPKAFQQTLAKAIDKRRQSVNGSSGPLQMSDSREVRFDSKGNFARLKPSKLGENIMFHDRNNRDLERTMQDLAENTLMHNASVELLRSRHTILESAISERV